jgi:hypothetical protein
MPLSEKTLAEMQAGASALAQHQGRQFHGPIDAQVLMEGLKSVQERMAAIKKWEREGVITIEHRSDPNYEQHGLKHTVIHHVTNGPSLAETPEALLCGGYPSELLTAQIAMAIVGCAKGDDNG